MVGAELLDFYLAVVLTGAARLDAAEQLTFRESLQQTLRDTLGPYLKSVQEPIDQWLGGLPMSVAMICAVGLYAIALVWVWGLRREFVFRGAPDQRWWRDLRIWATLVVMPYIGVYLVLGR